MNAMQKILNRTGQFIKHNSPTILTIIGAAGVIGSVVTAVTSTPKAMRRIEEAECEKGEELTKTEVVKVTAVVYIPTAIICAATLACIFSANILNQNHQAALTSAYALLDQSYKKYRKKVKELYGEEAEKTIKCEIAKDELEKMDVKKPEDDKMLFYDEYSERYFHAYEKDVIKAEYMANRAIMNEAFITLAEFYGYLGLSVDDESWNYIGWTCDDLAEWTGYFWLDFHHELIEMEDGIEATVIWYDVSPALGYISEYVDVPDKIKQKLEEFENKLLCR